MLSRMILLQKKGQQFQLILFNLKSQTVIQNSRYYILMQLFLKFDYIFSNNSEMNKYLLVAASVALILAVYSLSLSPQTQKLIYRINSTPDIAWIAGENLYFKDRKIQDIVGLMGTLETPQQMKLKLKKIQPMINLPQNFDSRNHWKNCDSIKQVRDQSTCGSCWAFGAVEAMSDRICIASGQKQQIRISAQDLLSCCGISCGMGCNGGWPSAAWTHYKRSGLSTGWQYNTTQWCKPYSFPPCDHHTTGKYQPCGAVKPTPKCSHQCVEGYQTQYKKDLHFGKDVYSISKNGQEIQTQIMTYGPVQASFSVYEDFLTYKAGVYHHVEGKNLGGHSIKILGWGSENGVDYWIAANSWNEDWGEKGFFKIKRGVNECGIQAQVVAGIPKMY